MEVPYLDIGKIISPILNYKHRCTIWVVSPCCGAPDRRGASDQVGAPDLVDLPLKE